jgi:hypothetical protein
MRTTITLDEDLLAEAKTRAARRKTTLSAVIADTLREAFQRAAEPSSALEPLPIFHGDGLVPGVDLNDGGSLWDADDLDEEPGGRP